MAEFGTPSIIYTICKSLTTRRISKLLSYPQFEVVFYAIER